MTEAKQVFKNSSQTYYYSSRFFPSRIRRDITTLYAFVRTADDFVDQIPQDKNGFYAFREAYASDSPDDSIISSFHELSERSGFDDEWTTSFLDAMEQDLDKNSYDSMDELRSYMHGSAEVIGLYITRILGVQGRDEAAKALGRGMQYINFLRDIEEDRQLNRQYIPQALLDNHGLSDLSRETTGANKKAFKALLKQETERGLSWLDEGRDAFSAIPYRCRIPIATATDMYDWTAQRVQENPFIVYGEQVKPATHRIIWTALLNALP